MVATKEINREEAIGLLETMSRKQVAEKFNVSVPTLVKFLGIAKARKPKVSKSKTTVGWNPLVEFESINTQAVELLVKSAASFDELAKHYTVLADHCRQYVLTYTK